MAPPTGPPPPAFGFPPTAAARPPAERAPRGQARALALDQLPDDALTNIFCRLERRELRLVPLVCKAWDRLLPRLRGLWRSTVVDLRRRQPDDRLTAVRFFEQRAAGIEDLALLLPKEQSLGLLRWVLRALLRGKAPLKRLCLDLSKVPKEPPANVEGAATRCNLEALPLALEWLPSDLEVLCITGLKDGDWEQRFDSMQHLMQLRVLQLLCEDCETPCWEEQLPRMGPHLEELVIAGAYDFDVSECLPEELSRLTRLTSISIIQTYPSGIPQEWTALTNLCTLWVGHWGRLTLPPSLAALARLFCVDLSCANFPAALSTLPALKHLTLRELWAPEEDGEHEEPDEDQQEQAFQGLLWWGLRLVSLRLIKCYLYAVPAAVASHASLRRLAMTGCHLCHLPSGAYLHHLEELVLTDNCFDHVPLKVTFGLRLRALSMLRGEPALDIAAARTSGTLATDLAALEARLRDSWAARLGNAVEWQPQLNRFVNDNCWAPADVQPLVREWAADGITNWAGLRARERFLYDVFLPMALS